MITRARLLRKGKKPELTPSKGWRVRVIISTHDGLIAWDDVDHLVKAPRIAEELTRELLNLRGR